MKVDPCSGSHLVGQTLVVGFGRKRMVGQESESIEAKLPNVEVWKVDNSYSVGCIERDAVDICGSLVVRGCFSLIWFGIWNWKVVLIFYAFGLFDGA